MVKSSLWPDRWPAIALQECIDKVEAAAPGDESRVRFELPCPTCPESHRCLNAKRRELGPLLYSREIDTSPRTSESSLFPYELLDRQKKHGEHCVSWWEAPIGQEGRYRVVQAWDLAWSEKIGGDWMVGMTARYDSVTGKRRLLSVIRVQRLTFDEQIDLIEQTWRQYNAEAVVLESDAAQTIWYQKVKKRGRVPVVKHAAGGSDGQASKRSLRGGVPSLLIALENDMWEWPWTPGGYEHENVDVFISELEAFSMVDGKLEGVGEHDDTVMCWWHLSWLIDRIAVQGGGGPREFYTARQPKSARL